MRQSVPQNRKPARSKEAIRNLPAFLKSYGQSKAAEHHRNKGRPLMAALDRAMAAA